MSKYPRDVHGQYMPVLLAKEYPELELPGLMYIDLWPVAPPMLAVFHPDMMAEFTQTTNLPKHPSLQGEFRPFTQLNDLLNMSGQAWKMWRNIFNPAFSGKNILSLMPAFLEEIDVFVADLKSAAESGEVIKLEDKAIMCTIDIIGRAILYVCFFFSHPATWLRGKLQKP
jgi:cytochrome P450